MNFLLRTVLASLFSLPLLAQVLPPPKLPQEGAPPPTTPTTVQLDVTVSGRDKKPVAGLAQSNFTILDNGAPAEILSFKAIKAPSDDPPIQVFLCLDTVNIDFQLVGQVRQRLAEFLKKSGPTLPYPLSFVILTENGTEIQQTPSTNTAELLTDLNSIETRFRTLTRSTGIYGAADRINISLTDLQQVAQAEQAKPGRKLVIWLSRGWAYLSGPNINLTNRDQAILFNSIVHLSTQLERARITLYSIDPIGVQDSASLGTSYYEEFLKGVAIPRNAQWGNLALQVFSVHTGGLAINYGNDVAGEIKDCIDDASAFYVITIPRARAETPNTLHTIQVKIPDTNLKPRTLFGYYAQP